LSWRDNHEDPLIVARVGGRPTPRVVDRILSAMAVDVHFEDRGVMNEAVYGRERHGLVGEDFSPFAKGLVCGDEHRSALVVCADQFEEPSTQNSFAG
jgi:hypothetical protein